MKQFKLWLVVLAMSLFSGVVSAKETLGEYIDRHCKTRCVSEMQLLTAAVRTAEELDIDFRILIAIAKLESGFKPMARNAQSFGLMQVNYPVHKRKFTSKNIVDPFQNVRVDGIIFKECLNRSRGNIRIAFRCYNGFGKGGDPQYVTKAIRTLHDVKNLTI